MQIEYSCVDYSITEHQVKTNIEYATKNSIKNICILPYSVPYIKNAFNDINIICPLDYPFGLSDIKQRNSMVLGTTKLGINTIDIVTPNKILTNRKYDKFRDDVKSNLEICNSANIELRYILEYRIFSHELLSKVCQILKDLGVNTVIPSSGLFLDDINDNLIVCNFLKLKSNINVICNGNIYLDKHMKTVLNSDIYGTRFYYKNSLDLYLNYVKI